MCVIHALSSRNFIALCLTGFFWGDPHIQTLDKKDYTFNGWGEYTMLELLSEETTAFVLQARTGRVKDSNGNFTNATIFTGFAAKDYVNTAIVQIELSNDRQGKGAWIAMT